MSPRHRDRVLVVRDLAQHFGVRKNGYAEAIELVQEGWLGYLERG